MSHTLLESGTASWQALQMELSGATGGAPPKGRLGLFVPGAFEKTISITLAATFIHGAQAKLIEYSGSLAAKLCVFDAGSASWDQFHAMTFSPTVVARGTATAKRVTLALPDWDD